MTRAWEPGTQALGEARGRGMGPVGPGNGDRRGTGGGRRVVGTKTSLALLESSHFSPRALGPLPVVC